MNKIKRSLPVLAISALALAVAGCGSDSNGGGGGVSKASASAPAKLGDHAEVLARVFLARNMIEDLSYGVSDTEDEIDDIVDDEFPPESVGEPTTQDCATSGTATTIQDEALSETNINGVAFDPAVALSRFSVNFASCTETFSEGPEYSETDSYSGSASFAIGTDSTNDDIVWVIADNFQNNGTSENSFDGGSNVWAQRSIQSGNVLSLTDTESYNARLVGQFELEEEGSNSETSGSSSRSGTGSTFELYRGVAPKSTFDITVNEGDSLLSGSIRLGIDAAGSFEEVNPGSTVSSTFKCPIPGTFDVEVTQELTYDSPFNDDPLSGELTLSSGNSEALVSFTGQGEMTITIDGVAELFGDNMGVWYDARDKARSCGGEGFGGPRLD